MAENNKKVLIVEDDPYAASLYELKLKKEGYQIELARNGKEAYGKVKRFNPDLIILDLLLPGVDGFQILKNLRIEKKIKIPILVLSNLGEEENVKKAIGLGADDYMVKVETAMDELVQKVNNLVK